MNRRANDLLVVASLDTQAQAAFTILRETSEGGKAVSAAVMGSLENRELPAEKERLRSWLLDLDGLGYNSEGT